MEGEFRIEVANRVGCRRSVVAVTVPIARNDHRSGKNSDYENKKNENMVLVLI